MTNGDTIRERALGFYNLALGFARLQSIPKYDIKQYQSKDGGNFLWFSDIQDAGHMDVVFPKRQTDEDDEIVGSWIQVTHENAPQCPQPPDSIENWIDKKYPYNSDNEKLTLRKEIIREENTDGAGGDSNDELSESTEYLKDHPEVSNAFDDYWVIFDDWRKTHQIWKKKEAIFQKLYSMHRALEREGETLELCIGIGLLCWRTPKDRNIRRHLLTITADLELCAEEGRISIGPSPTGTKINCELDMLDQTDRPPKFTARVEQYHEKLQNNVWNLDTLDEIFTAAATELVGGRGEFSKNVKPPDTPDERPRLTLAPAVILRKRSTSKKIERFETIVKSLEEGVDIPPNVKKISTPTGRENGDDGPPPDPGEVWGGGEVEEILFPLASNREQFRIIEKFHNHDGVLVQGPPGTGKTHTIANLICHLLSQGQRILVTAETPRALRVLREQIPESVRPLCLSVLGHDKKAMEELQGSVEVILGRRENQPEDEENKIEQLRKELEAKKRRQSEIDGVLKKIREAETKSITISGTDYQGTAMVIAVRVRKEESQYRWFEDRPGVDDQFPVEVEKKLKRLLGFGRQLTNHPAKPINQHLPEPEREAPNPASFRDLLGKIRDAEDEMEKLFEGGDHPEIECIKETQREQLEALLKVLQDLLTDIDATTHRPGGWIPRAVNQVLADNDLPWKELQRKTMENLGSIEDKRERVEQIDIELPEGVDRSKLRADAKDLQMYLERGGKLGLWSCLFKQTVKRTRYVTQKVRVDGRPAETIERLGMLLNYLDILRTLDRIWADWEKWVKRRKGQIWEQVARIQEHVEDLDHVIEIDRNMRKSKQAVQKVAGLNEPRWTELKEVEKLIVGCRYARAWRDQQNAERGVDERVVKLRNIVSGRNAHKVTEQLADALENRSIDVYEEVWQTLQRQIEANRLQNEIGQLRDGLVATFPVLIEAICDDPTNQEWNDRLESVSRAWNWGLARAWIDRFREEHEEGTLGKEYERVVKKKAEVTEELAARKAWRSCLEGLGDHESQHLETWRQVVRSIGAGTGRHAERKRREAQRLLAECRGSIPAWVLPLYRVYEQIDPEPGMFDVVIVDEASQCSIDSLILLYLGKKIIVVGDDEQISPSKIGVNEDDLRDLIQTHLPEVSVATGIGRDTSLFDLAKRWFGLPLTLREHFRCMPEIIGFSNRLSYVNKPLIPLTQYGADRLDPVKHIAVNDGYVCGSGQNMMNEPEAEEIVTTIVNCCKDPRYQGKTMGVISLTGNAHAKKIESLLMESLDPEELESRRMVCGNAYSFQGDERDIMFLSLMIARLDENNQTRTNPAQTIRSAKQRFNVAASRAKEQMWLFHSVDLDDIRNPGCVRRQLLEYCQNPEDYGIEGIEDNLPNLERLAHEANRQNDDPPDPFDSWFEVDVCLCIARRGYRVKPQFEFAGYRIDLVVFDGGQKLAVECDGDRFHGLDRFQEDQDRQRQLERAGWTFCRIRGSAFGHDPEGSLEELWRMLDELKICPAGADSPSLEDHGSTSGVTVQTPQKIQTESTESATSEPDSSDSGESTENGERDQNHPAFQLTNPPPTVTKRLPWNDQAHSTSTSPAEETVRPDHVQLGPYHHWPMRKLQDPRESSIGGIMIGLKEIIEAEAPLTKHRAYDLYRQGAGLGRAGRIIHEKLDRALQVILRNGAVTCVDEERGNGAIIEVIKLGNNNTCLRTRGDRVMTDGLPPSELEALMREVIRVHRLTNQDSIYRKTQEYLELGRLRSSTRVFFDQVFSCI